MLSRIAPVKKRQESLKFSVYGRPKTGKTRFACTFPKPLLIIGSEDGTASVVGSQGIDFVQLENTDEFTELVEGPVRQGRYASVVVDNGTKLREMRIKEIFAGMGMGEGQAEEMPERKPFLYADKVWKAVWIQTGQDLRKMFSKLLDMPRFVPVNVVIIAQEQNFNYDDDGTSDIMAPSIGSALGKTLCDFVNAECDYVAQTFIREGVEKVKTKNKITKKEEWREKKTGKMEYCLRVGPHDTYYTGFRQNIGAPPLPECIVDGDYVKVLKLVNG